MVYRSVLLPFMVILTAVFALGLACAVVYAEHPRTGTCVRWRPGTPGILAHGA
ncbi:hypothetical protein AB0G31_24200 [Streptomyces fradiae]